MQAFVKSCDLDATVSVALGDTSTAHVSAPEHKVPFMTMSLADEGKKVDLHFDNHVLGPDRALRFYKVLHDKKELASYSFNVHKWTTTWKLPADARGVAIVRKIVSVMLEPKTLLVRVDELAANVDASKLRKTLGDRGTLEFAPKYGFFAPSDECFAVLTNTPIETRRFAEFLHPKARIIDLKAGDLTQQLWGSAWVA